MAKTVARGVFVFKVFAFVQIPLQECLHLLPTETQLCAEAGFLLS